MKTAFLFAGQGAQKAGMGKDIYETYPLARAIYDNTTMPFDLQEVCFTDTNNLLSDTTYVQPCLLTTSVAIARVLEDLGITPDYVCGLSLGEYSALTFTKAFELSDAQQIVYQRGTIMREALPPNTTGMSAVLNLDGEIIQSICEQVSGVCEVANYNCPGQIVISGELKALKEAGQRCLEAGARRVMPLAVSGAFHTSLLQEAGKKLKNVLNQYPIKQPAIPVIYNVSGKEETGDISELLCRQIHSSVYFEQSIRYLIERGVSMFIEIGPGSTLAGFVRKIDKTVTVISVETADQIKKLEQLWKEKYQ